MDLYIFFITCLYLWLSVCLILTFFLSCSLSFLHIYFFFCLVLFFSLSLFSYKSLWRPLGVKFIGHYENKYFECGVEWECLSYLTGCSRFNQHCGSGSRSLCHLIYVLDTLYRVSLNMDSHNCHSCISISIHTYISRTGFISLYEKKSIVLSAFRKTNGFLWSSALNKDLYYTSQDRHYFDTEGG